MTILKTFNICDLKKSKTQKKYFKRGDVNNRGILNYLILKLEGKQINLCQQLNLSSFPSEALHMAAKG